MILTRFGLEVNATASVGTLNIFVVANWLLNPGTVVPDAFAIAASAAAVRGSLPNITDMVSYHAPMSALPKFGFAFRVAAFTTMRSMISPGMRVESNTSVVLGMAMICASCGFQATVAVVPGAA